MNQRILIAAGVGAVVYFIWGILAWLVLPLHTPTMHRFTDPEGEKTVAAELYGQAPGPGWYSIPSLPEEIPSLPEEKELSDEEKKENMKKRWLARHEEGPVVNIFYNEGGKPMPPQMFVRGMAINLVSALLAAVLLSWSDCRSYVKRVWFVITLGAFTAVVAHMSYWNWMWFPLDYTLGMCLDVLVGWTLVGLAIAGIVRPQAAPASPSSSPEGSRTSPSA